VVVVVAPFVNIVAELSSSVRLGAESESARTSRSWRIALSHSQLLGFQHLVGGIGECGWQFPG